MKVNLPEKEKANVTRPCLVATCRGNENIADLLNYLIYEAHELVDKKKVEGNDITLQLTHDKMLNRPNNEGKRFNFSEKSLISYLRKLDTWKLVSIGKYGRSQIVHTDVINQTIANPPAKPKGKPRGKRKSGNVEQNNTSTKRSTLNVELQLKVVTLQENVEKLQLKVETLQQIVETLQLSQSSNAAPQVPSEAKNRPLYSVDTVYSVDFFIGASYRDDDEPVYPPIAEKKEVSSIAYSQGDKQTDVEKKWVPLFDIKAELAELDKRMDVLDAQYLALGNNQEQPTDVSASTWLQENKSAPQASSASITHDDRGVSQQELIPTEKPIVQPATPRKPLSMKPDVPNVNLTQKEIDTLKRNRMADIMLLCDNELGTKLPRSPKTFVKEALEDLVGSDRTDEQILFSLRDNKARGRDLNFTEIAKNMATAIDKMSKGLPPGVLPFNKPTPQQEVRKFDPAKNFNNVGSHLDPSFYDEEVYVMPARKKAEGVS